HPRPQGLDLPLPHRRRSGPARDRRHPGAELHRGLPRHRGDRLQGLRLAGVRADARPDDLAAPGHRNLRRLSAHVHSNPSSTLPALGALLALALPNPPAAVAAGAAAGGASPFDNAHWIWSAPAGDARRTDDACHLAVEFTLAAAPTKATAWVSADNHFRLFVDGDEAGHGDDWSKPTTLEIAPQ